MMVVSSLLHTSDTTNSKFRSYCFWNRDDPMTRKMKKPKQKRGKLQKVHIHKLFCLLYAILITQNTCKLSTEYRWTSWTDSIINPDFNQIVMKANQLTELTMLFKQQMKHNTTSGGTGPTAESTFPLLAVFSGTAPLSVIFFSNLSTFLTVNCFDFVMVRCRLIDFPLFYSTARASIHLKRM